MGALDGRVAVITGSGRGIGREHALLFAAEGAKVVVNDLGGSVDGSGDDRTAAQQVVDEITAGGGQAIANGDDVTDWDGGKRLIDSAIEAYGDLHVLVNNAGILRDRVLVNMSEEEWDSVIHVHLKGHFVPTRHAAAYWREQTKAGKEVRAAVVNTSSTSGLLGNPGQSNYGAAKAGIGAFTTITAEELSRYGVRVNAIAPAARTRMTEQTPGSVGHRAGSQGCGPVRLLGSGQRLAPGGLPVHRGVPGHRQGVLRPGWPDPALQAVDDDGHAGKGRPLDGGRAADGDAAPRRLTWDRGPGRSGQRLPKPGAPCVGRDARAHSVGRDARAHSVGRDAGEHSVGREPGARRRPRRPGAQRRPRRSSATALSLESGAGAGAEGGVIVPWPVLLRHRAHDRVRSSDRYQWWVLWTVLAGLLSVNITFTVFVVALPKVAAELHTSVSTLTWTSTGPLVGLRGGRAGTGEDRRRLGPPAAVPMGTGRCRCLCRAHRNGSHRRRAHHRPGARRRRGGGNRGGVDGPHPAGVLGGGPGQGHGLVGAGGRRRPGHRGDGRRAHHPVPRLAGALLVRAAADGGGHGPGRGRTARPYHAAHRRNGVWRPVQSRPWPRGSGGWRSRPGRRRSDPGFATHGWPPAVAVAAGLGRVGVALVGRGHGALGPQPGPDLGLDLSCHTGHGRTLRARVAGLRRP